MRNPRSLIALAVSLAAPIPSFAATNFTDDDPTDSLVSNPLNWDNGLPTGGANLGALGIDAIANATILDGYEITQTDGVLSNTGTTTLNLGTAAYVLDGASAEITGFRNLINAAGGVFTVEDGTVDLASASDSSFGGEFIVNGGSVTISRRLTGSNSGGTVIINGGVVTSSRLGTDNNIGGSNLPKGDFFLNGGDIDFRFMQVGNSDVDFFFGGSTAGNLTIENFGGFRHNPALIDLDFAPGSQMSLTLTNPVAFDDPDGDERYGWADDNLGPDWAEALWNDGRLSYNNDTVSGVDILGEGGTTVLTWAEALIDLGDGSQFVFDSSTNTLSLGSGTPPPSEPIRITDFFPVSGQSDVWQVSLTGDASADYVFRSSTILDFSTAGVVENLAPGVPAAGTIGGTNNSVVTTDGSGAATVRITLNGHPEDFVRAETAP